jgi:hypothetical protein
MDEVLGPIADPPEDLFDGPATKPICLPMSTDYHAGSHHPLTRSNRALRVLRVNSGRIFILTPGAGVTPGRWHGQPVLRDRAPAALAARDNGARR